MEAKDNQKWEVLSSEYIIRRPWLTARRDQIRLPNGIINPEFYVLEYPTWVNTIAITTDGKFVMVEQYRHGLGETGMELCAGVCEEGETPEQAARRELEEETGYTGGNWSELTVLSANPSTTNNLTHCFLAIGVEPAGHRHLDRTEYLTVRLLTESEVFDLLVSDSMKQALMVAPLWKYFYNRRR